MLSQKAKFHSVFMAEQYSIVCFSVRVSVCEIQCTYATLIVFVHSSVDEHLSCFHNLGSYKQCYYERWVHVHFQISVFIFFFSDITEECNCWFIWKFSHMAGGFFTSWATREAQEYWTGYPISSLGDLPYPGIELGSLAL